MGYFLACFGCPGGRKRRKHGNRVLAGDRSYGRYEPLYSAKVLEITEDPVRLNSQLREKTKEGSSFKVRKKVSFNLNLQIYEPITSDHQFSDSEEEKTDESTSCSEGHLAFSKMGFYPHNHRYRNYTDAYDEYDEMGFKDSDLESEEFDDYDEDKNESENEEEAKYEISRVHSVLTPIENITQWKAVKRSTAATTKLQKENVVLKKEREQPIDKPYKALMQEKIQLDASLSNWLILQNLMLREDQPMLKMTNYRDPIIT